MLGDEQVFDVELDRNTQLLPVRADVRKLAWKDGDGVDNVRDDLGGKIEGSAAGDEQGEYDFPGRTLYGWATTLYCPLCSDSFRILGVKATLRTLLQQVPITVRGEWEWTSSR